MESFSSLLALCVFMFIGSMGAGMVPLWCALSPSRIKALTTFGAGLLVGTALIVIIPEGVHMWYMAEAAAKEALHTAGSSHAASHASATLALATQHAAGAAHGVAAATLAAVGSAAAGAVNQQVAASVQQQPSLAVGGNQYSQRKLALRGAVSAHDHEHGSESGEADHEHEHEHGHAHSHGHQYIGASLACGFAFALIVDTVGGGHGHGHDSGHGHAHGEDDHDHHHDDDESKPLADGDSGPDSDGSGQASGDGAVRRTQSAAVGLLVHAAVDGIALGAAAAAGQSSVEGIVFLAIMLHKAPAAFGMATFLIHNSATPAQVKRALFMFSSAAPVAAISTFYVLSMGIVGTSSSTLAIFFMFSGGTFLYVSAAHILPEVQASHSDDGSAGARQAKYANMWLLVLGLMLPLFINIEHGH